MGFFAEFNAWLTMILDTYISDVTARTAAALEPTIVTLAVLYIVVWGYMHLIGKIEQPFIEGAKRLILLAMILGVSLSLWLYNAVIVDTFFNAPTQLAAAAIGGYDSVSAMDEILRHGGDAGYLLIQKGGILEGNFAFYLAGFAVHLFIGLAVIYTVFLLTLSRIALSILIALGPLFVALLVSVNPAAFFRSIRARGQCRSRSTPTGVSDADDEATTAERGCLVRNG